MEEITEIEQIDSTGRCGPQYGVALVDGDLKRSGIYQIRCVVTGKIYIGSAVKIGVRWDLHLLYLERGNHHCSRLQRAWVKYGASNFAFEVLEFIDDREQLIVIEQHYLDTWMPWDRSIGFNGSPTAGSRLGMKNSEETRQKLSKAIRGRKLSEEHKRKIGEAALGRKHTEESLKKMSKVKLGKKFSEEHRRNISNGRQGIPFSEETRQKMSESQRGRKQTEETKRKVSEANRGRRHPEETRAKGEEHGMAKTTWLEVREIRAKHATGKYTYASLALEYEIHRVNISRIVRNKIWVEDGVIS
jgi:group I intron endonuclease